MKQNDVIKLFDQIFEKYDLPTQFFVRNDNGSQFIADAVQIYFKGKTLCRNLPNQLHQSETLGDAQSYRLLPQYHGKSRLQKYEFDDLKCVIEIMNQFQEFYSFHRIHSRVKYKSPYKFLLKQ